MSSGSTPSIPGPCNQNNLSYRDDHAEGFAGHMAGHGHPTSFDWGNDNAWATDFRHPDFGGDSHNWTDNVHFCYYADHGGNWGNVMHIAFAIAHGNCLASSDQWHLGARMMKWLVLDCCQAVLNTDPGHISSGACARERSRRGDSSARTSGSRR